jgi:DNA-directed RNA polymerase subunit RPC12/RpoP
MASLPVTPASDTEYLRTPTHICTYCGSDEIYRQRPRGLIERHIFKVLHFLPYWCAGCDKRFYIRSRKSPARSPR